MGDEKPKCYKKVSKRIQSKQSDNKSQINQKSLSDLRRRLDKPWLPTSPSRITSPYPINASPKHGSPKMTECVVKLVKHDVLQALNSSKCSLDKSSDEEVVFKQ